MTAQQFLASLAGLQRIKTLEAGCEASKEELLAVEVSLPLACGEEVASLRVLQMRPAYERCSRPLLVDVSRLPAP